MYISAALNRGIDDLLACIEKNLSRGLHHVTFLLPYALGGQVERLHQDAKVLSCEYESGGIRLEVICDETVFGQLRQYLVEEHG